MVFLKKSHLVVCVGYSFLSVFGLSSFANTETTLSLTGSDIQKIDEPIIPTPIIPTLNDERATKILQQNEAVTKANQDLHQGELNDLIKSGPVTIDETWTSEQIYSKLEEDPDAFERLLLHSISSSNSEALKALVPVYDKYPQKDPSVVEWGDAIIALSEGRTQEAVALFRKLNAVLPDVRLLRLQMASALYQNKQYRSAKDELQKLLRDENITEYDKKQLTGYIDAINRLDKWNYSFDLSFVKEDNLDNNPEVGTISAIGWAWREPHQSGTGARYDLGANKRWSYDNKLFTSFSSGVGGVYYWDNKRYNEIYGVASVGVGYQSATAEIEIAPSFSQSWRAKGRFTDEDSDTLKPYYLTKGVRVSALKWLNPKVMYQHNSTATAVRYEEPATRNNADVYSISNGFLYAPNAKKYYSVSWSVSKKDSHWSDSESYESSGVAVRWQNTWPKGVVTNTSLGITSKKYSERNIWFMYPRHNREYNVGLNVWKRDFSIFGLTPKLHLSASQITSNDNVEERSSVDANISLSKTF